MADRTITSSLVQNRMVFRENRGVNVAYCNFDFHQTPGSQGRETLSPSLVIQMIPLPDQARILDMWIRSDRATTGGYVVGDSSLSNRFMTGSLSVAGQLTRMPQSISTYKVSLTASSINDFYTINVVINGTPTASATGCIAMAVFYTIDYTAS